MVYDDVSIEELEKRVIARREQVNKIVSFAEAIIPKRGKMIQRGVLSSNTHVVYRLIGFRDFSFLFSTGETMMGGNTIKVWYHPESDWDERNEPALYVYYQVGLERCEVLLFNQDNSWQTALKYVISHEEEIAAQAAKEESDQKELRRLVEERRRQRAQLEEEAKRLKV